MPRFTLALIAIIGLGLAACGDTATERGLSGAAIGAAGGAAWAAWALPRFRRPGVLMSIDS